MKPAAPRDMADTMADPFHERTPCTLRTRVCVLGGVFHFESNSRQLLRLVDRAFDNLPAHVFAGEPPTFRIRMLLASDEGPAIANEPPCMRLHAGAGFLCGMMDAANFAVISPAQQTALLLVSGNMLQYPYHVRYELIEFVVYTLASRVQNLVSLHAACVGRNGRGLLLIGATGGGKTTLALHSVLQGLDLVAEDGILATPDTLHATGIGAFLHLRADSLRFVDGALDTRLRKSPTIRRRSGVEKFEVDLRRTRYALARTPLQIASVIMLSKKGSSPRRGPHPLLKPLSKTELRRQLDASQPYAAGQPGWSEFRKGITAIGGFELARGRHPDEGVAALRTLLE